MSTNVTSTNPVVQAIVSGTAPQPARLAAARGLLPLPQSDLLEMLVALHHSDNAEIAEAAGETLESQNAEDLLVAARTNDTAPSVLGYIATHAKVGREIHEGVVLNRSTPADAIAALATVTTDGLLLEMIATNQQRLVNAPAIIDAILANPARTPEAERRARETRREFFEKERGARQIAEELRARGKTAAAEFFEAAELTTATGQLSAEDAWIIASHIEVSDADIDDSWLPSERYEELLMENFEELAAHVERVIEHEHLAAVGEVPAERVSLIRKLMFMNPRDRLKLAMKGDREARSILIRDSNRVVATAVVKNPRITDKEVENIAAMRQVSADVLRLIVLNRAWARQYPIIHNLVRNPRAPIPTVVSTLPRIRTNDLVALSQNRNVSEAVRNQAARLSRARSGK